MSQLSELIGEHVLEIVPAAARHPLSSDAGGVVFTLDETTYLIFEDPSDGYRSSAGPILSFKGSAYELGYEGYDFPTYIREAVLCSHRTKGEYGGEDDVLEMRSKETGQVVFEIGTENVDDYYPGFVNRWNPAGLSVNSKERVSA